jgi:hypothetical protein
MKNSTEASFGITLRIVKLIALPLVCLGLCGGVPLRAETPQPADPGDFEHYHHEFYSHSYLDPNYREDLNNPSSGGLSKSKTNRTPFKSNTKASIAFGGHRHTPTPTPRLKAKGTKVEH